MTSVDTTGATAPTSDGERQPQDGGATRTLRLGYKASAEQFGPADLLRFSIAAERHGFDSVFISDHLQPWWHDGGHAPAALPWLGALGASTSHNVMGTTVLTPTIR